MGFGIETSITGAGQLERVARACKEAGRSDLRKELLAGVRKSVKPAKDAVQQSVRAIPAKRNVGLRESIARAVTVRTRTAGKSAGVKVTINTAKLPDGKQRLPRLMNKGQWSHPLFGDKDHWYPQRSTPQWFDGPLRQLAPEVKSDLVLALATIARKIEGAA